MSLFTSDRKSVVLLFVSSVLVAVILSAVTAFSGTSGSRAGGAVSPSTISAYEDRQAIEAYEQRNAQIDSRKIDNITSNHNNAALLYYQALLLKPDYSQSDLNKIYDVYGGAEPDTQTRIFLGKWLPTMKMSEIASHIKGCTWGAYSEPQIDAHFLNTKLRPLCYVIAADTITLASDGHYKAALERCMTLRRIARHLSYDSKLHISSSLFDGMALNAVRVILSDMPPDADILTWLQGRLSEFHEATPFFEKRLQKSLKEKINMVHSSSVAKLRDMLLKTATDEQARQYIIALTDEQVRTRAIETVQSYFVSIFEILHSDKSAEQKRSEIEALANYKPNIDLFRASMNIYNEFGGGISSFITGIDAEMTEEQKLSEIQKIIEKSAEPNAIKSLTMFSDALKKKIDFGFIADNKITNDQKLLEMKKALKELANAFALETSTFGIPAYIITGSLFKSHIGYEAQVNSTKAAVEIYLVTAKTGKLPEKLPDYLPKDPYTGEAFEYETSGDGFVLRCRDEDKTEFKFKIRIGE